MVLSKESKKSDDKELAGELDLHDDMISALVELLEAKGVISEGEWEKHLRKKLKEGQGLEDFRNLK